MGMTRLAQVATAATAIAFSVPLMSGIASAAPLAASQKAARTAKAAAARVSFNQSVAISAQLLRGVPYVYGGTSPSGFDCSGMTQYVYRRVGKKIQRTAEGQFREFRRISRAHAWGGDLVFFHESSNPNSYVYHVGIYEGGKDMMVASTGDGRVEWESFAWAGDTVTFGTITH